MSRVVQFASGLVLLAAAIMAVQTLATAPSRARLDALREERGRLLETHATLRERLHDLRAAPSDGALPAGLTWPAPSRAEAEFALQGVTLDVAAKEGLVPSSYGPAAAPPDVEISAAAFQLEALGPWGRVLGFLKAMREAEPQLSISELSIRTAPPTSVNPPEAQVAIRVVFWGFAPGAGETP